MPMTGHLDLVCAADADGRSYLREQSFRAPMHISKPFLDEEVLVVNVVNPTAGLFAGDELRCSVRVEQGARLLLTSPGANRAHRMIKGEARVTQEFLVAHDGCLEVWPEILIPQAGARYRQDTRIEVEPGGDFLSIEMLAPGRVASGETFEFDRLDFQTDVFLGGELVARERYRLSPQTMSLHSLRAQFPSAYYAGCYLLSERIQNDAECREQIANLQTEAVRVGFSRLVRGGWTIKVLARDAIALRNCISELRRVLYYAMHRPLPTGRKL